MTAPYVPRRPTREVVAWIVLGTTAWLALVSLILAMYLARTPPSAGFDLELLLLGGRRVAAGLTPYDTALIAGQSVEIQSLFYSYPPLVAQTMSIIAGVPSLLVLLVWGLGASVAAVAVAGLLERRMTGQAAARLLLPTAALLPLWFPFAIALMFGNLDAWFVALFGLLLVGALAADTAAGNTRLRRGDLLAAGLALALASITKLHPASLGLWFLIRGLLERRGGATGLAPSWTILAIAAATGVAAMAASLVLGGIGPWADYLAVLRAGTNADLLDSRNLGPAVQVALAAGAGADAVRAMQVAVTLLAVLATGLVAWRLRDPVESLAWATVASFIVLPVTWYHYPSALVPFAVAAVVRSGDAGSLMRCRTIVLLAAALLLGIVGMGLPIMWLSILVLMFGIRTSRSATGSMAAAPRGAAPVRA